MLAYRAAAEINERITALLQDSGLLHREIGRLIVDDDGHAGRLPSGEDLQRLFNTIDVLDSELVSEAERAWKFGNAEAAERAAIGREPR